MIRFEEETGRKAIWRGKVTDTFYKWRKGEKNLGSDKKLITLSVSEEKVKDWREFVNNSEITTVSKLIRESVDLFIKTKTEKLEKPKISYIHDLDEYGTHDILERLTTIKGFLQLILENYKNELNQEVVTIIHDIIEETDQLKNKLVFNKKRLGQSKKQYDILLVDDDLATLNLLSNYFKGKGYSLKGVLTGKKAIEELDLNTPKLILLDIILPDISGFSICSDLKTNKRFKNIPIIYLTAIPAYKVEENMVTTKADGYILKPFNLSDFEIVVNYL